MPRRCILITAPAGAVVDLDEAKAQLQITDGSQDALVQALIDACVQQLDPAGGGFLGRALRTQVWDLLLDTFPAGEIRVPYPPLVSIGSFTYVDAAGATQTLVANTGYRIVQGGLAASSLVPPYGACWPSARCDVGSVRVRFTAGYAEEAEDTLPVPIKRAVLLMVRQLYDSGARDSFLSSSEVDGVGARSYFATGRGEAVLSAARRLLNTYRVDWF